MDLNKLSSLLHRLTGRTDPTPALDDAPDDLVPLTPDAFPNGEAGMVLHHALMAHLKAGLKVEADKQFDEYRAKREAAIALDPKNEALYEPTTEHALNREIYQGCLDTVVGDAMAVIGVERTMLILARAAQLPQRIAMQRMLSDAILEALPLASERVQ